MRGGSALFGLNRRGRPGFTLIEFLVAVAVLAILAAVLLPIFSRSREMSYRAKCASNLRQLGGGFGMYASDWNGWWPCPGGLYGNRGYWSQTGEGGLNAYVEEAGLDTVWCCPKLTEWSGRFPARSYSMNSYLRTPPDVEYPSCIGILRGIAVTRIFEPSRTILLYEGVPRSTEYNEAAYTEDQVYYIYRCANWTWVRGYYSRITHTIEPGKPWHGRVNNYLYTDGHVVAREPGKRTVAALSTYSEMREWYVNKAYFEQTYNRYWAGSVPRE